MSILFRFLKPIVKALVGLFRHDLVLKRSERGVAIVLERRAAQGRGPSRRQQREDEARRKARAELELLLAQLKDLLDEIPESRGSLKQLVFVEHALQRKGLMVLHRLPLPVLRKALGQLEGLVTNWSPHGLANLRSKLAVAIIDREHHDPEKSADASRTAAVAELLDTVPAGLSSVPELPERSDDEALAAAYAQWGRVAPPATMARQGDPGSATARAPAPVPTRSWVRPSAGKGLVS